MSTSNDTSLSSYINRCSKNITYHGEQDGVQCYSSDDGTITIAATNENDYSIMYIEGDRYTQTHYNRYSKEIYDYSQTPIATDIFTSNEYVYVNYHSDKDRNGISEWELSKCSDGTIEEYRRDNETDEIINYSRKDGENSIGYRFNDDGTKSVIFVGEKDGLNPEKWSREYTLDELDNIISITSTTQDFISDNYPGLHYWDSPQTEYYSAIDLDAASLAQEPYESFNNWVKRENIMFNAARKLENPTGEIKAIWDGIKSFFNQD